ncbi:hypothetical protein [Massilia sp. ST3]|uniref:hypothetical protein n=1 Tax=Massilia sp. ST3 TaxID=2824903 RepID=UPI001B835EF6|nr:hypothetical protein [Massilia sp. ST3]MBQ5948172.1 hypothetical protein [Massilia sp. ST3]
MRYELGRNNASDIVPAFAGTTLFEFTGSSKTVIPAKAGIQVCVNIENIKKERGFRALFS